MTAYNTLLGLYLPVMILGTTLNLILLCTMLTNKKLRADPRNTFILALAFSDFFLCNFTSPLTLWATLEGHWPFGKSIPDLTILWSNCTCWVVTFLTVYFMYTKKRLPNTYIKRIRILKTTTKEAVQFTVGWTVNMGSLFVRVVFVVIVNGK